MMAQPPILEDSGDNLRYSSPIQATITPSSGWTTGGEEITITGSGFSDLAFSNTTDDGINHQWVETTMDYTDEAGRYNSIVADSNGHIHAVHISGGNYQIRHSVYDGNNWNSFKIDDCEGDGSVCWDPHMVIDGNDELHVAYTLDNGWSERVVYMHYDGTAWTEELITSNAHFGPVGIAVDSNNHPHISYGAKGEYCGNGLRIASYDGSSWTDDVVEEGDNRGCESAMVIDENDNIYIAYQNRDNSKLKIATDKSGSWDAYTVDTGTSPSNLYPGYMTSMVMDGQGQFHIAHFDDKEDDLRYSTGAPNGPWSTTIIDSTGHTGREPSIALDPTGNVHIVYNSWYGWDLKYAVYNSTTSLWDQSSISTIGDVGKGNSLSIDQYGVMHVAFSDETDDVLKYATKSTGLLQTNEITVQFGQYGSVTGTVVNDTTIAVTTPTAIVGTVDITLMDKDGYEHILSSAFSFISQDDLDSDGVLNTDDDCPTVAGNSTHDLSGCTDDDGDGYSNTGDAFPNDANDWADSDDDGVGDNSDAFPNDAGETLDSDGDGVGDNVDEFPDDGNETVDSDEDGVGDNADAFPDDANETSDSDGDGVGDNADAFPYNAIEAFDSDGDGVGDNSDAFPNDGNETMDSDGDGVGDNADIFPNDANESIDSDGDGIGDNTDEFPLTDNLLDSDGDGYLDSEDEFSDEPTQWNDTDDDGYGDNWGNSDWNESRTSEGVGVFIEGALLSDYCPEVNGNSTDDGYAGCLDVDGNGIADIFELNETNQTNQTNGTMTELDSDGDGVLDTDDACPGTKVDTQVDNFGCKVVDTQNTESDSIIDSFMSGNSGTITTTVGIGAIMIALFSLLQTNLVAALLPDAFRWVQVLRKKSKLSTEEVNELTYLQSLVQAYYHNPSELYEELEDMKFDLTARYTNNEVKKETREKLVTLINELQQSNANQLKRIAHNEAYFGLIGTIDTIERTELLEEKVAMSDTSQPLEPVYNGSQQLQEVGVNAPPPLNVNGVIKGDGYEWYEWPESSGSWWFRTAYTQDQWQYYRQ